MRWPTLAPPIASAIMSSTSRERGRHETFIRYANGLPPVPARGKCPPNPLLFGSQENGRSGGCPGRVGDARLRHDGGAGAGPRSRSDHTEKSREGLPMPLEIKILDYGDIELESSFLVLGPGRGRTARG